MKKIIAIASLSLIVLYACDTRTYEEISPKVDPTVPVTYTNTVKKIMDNNCISCHSPATADELPYLTTYAEVKATVDINILRMKDQVKPMPKSGNLPASVIGQVEAWKAAGMPE